MDSTKAARIRLRRYPFRRSPYLYTTRQHVVYVSGTERDLSIHRKYASVCIGTYKLEMHQIFREPDRLLLVFRGLGAEWNFVVLSI